MASENDRINSIRRYGQNTPNSDRTRNYTTTSRSGIDVLEVNTDHAKRELDSFFKYVEKASKKAQSETRQIYQSGMYRSSQEDCDRYYDNELRRIDSVRKEISKLGLDQEKYDRARISLNKRVYDNELKYIREVNAQQRISEHLKGRFGNSVLNRQNSISGKKIELERMTESIEIDINKLNSLDPKSQEYNALKDRIKTSTREIVELQDNIEMLSNSIDKDVQKRESVINTMKGAVKTALLSAANVISQSFQAGVTDYTSAYEKSFTDIAGRTGSNYNQTRDLFSKSIEAIRSAGLSSAINISSEMIPALSTAVQQGFTGTDVISKAIADSTSSIIMPWLDTASDAWINMSMNMSKDNMELLKSQQLQLQSTKSGNRLLQSGVVNSLTSDLEPLLRNIDLNTGGAGNLSKEYQDLMAGFMDQGMSAQDAYAQVSEMIKASRDQYGAITSGNISQILMGKDFANGLSPTEVANGDINKIYEMAAGSASDLTASALFNTMGMVGSAFTKEIARERSDGAKAAASGINRSDIAYADIESQINEYRTTTTRATNAHENSMATVGSWVSAIPFGEKWFIIVVDLLKTIGAAVIASRIAPALWSSIKGLFKDGGLLKGLGSTLKSSLPKIGTSALKYGGIAAGLGMAAYGGINTYNSLKEYNDRSNTDRQKVVSGTSAGGYALGAAGGLIGAIGLLAGSGPVGWAGLAVGAAALLGVEIYKSYNKTSQVLNDLNTEFDKQEDILSQINDKNKTYLDNIATSINSAGSLEDKRKILLEQGLATEEQLAGMTSTSITNFLDSLQKAGEDLCTTQKKILEDLEKQAKETSEAARSNNEKKIKDDILASSGEEQLNKLRALGYTEAEISRIGGSKGLFGWGGTYTAEDLLNERYDRFLGIFGGQTKMEKSGAQAYSEYNSLYNPDGYQDMSVDSELLRQISEAAGYLLENKGTTIPAYKTRYDEYKALLKDLSDKSAENSLLVERALGSPLSSYATGNPYVYEDGIVKVHQGERIMTKAENANYVANSYANRLISRILGTNFNNSQDDDDMSRRDMIKYIKDGLSEIVVAVSNIKSDITGNGINYDTRTLPRQPNQYNQNLLTLAPSISK